VGKFLKAIGVKWIWDNILKPIVDLVKSLFGKKPPEPKPPEPEKCGGRQFNPDKECCVKGVIVEKCGGECYNPENICCTDGKKSDDMFSNTEFPLENCPNRIARTDDRKGVSDGCSVPNSVKPGLQAIALGAQNRLIWNFDDPVGGGESTTFSYACDAHDACYAACNNPSLSNLVDSAKQGYCDEKMLKVKMNDVCDSLKDPKVQASCNFWEITYLAGVWLKGEAHYTAAQKKWCKCCPIGSK
jgi:hypothetical protein